MRWPPAASRTGRSPFTWSTDVAAGGAEHLVEGMTWAAASNEQLQPLLSRVLAASLDAADTDAVAQVGADAAAVELLESVADWGCSYQPEWWRILSDEQGPAGFVLPVLYLDGHRDGRADSTIFHLGVSPDRRGQGLASVLLGSAVTSLTECGVWRIYCDTDVDNAPMSRTFERCGWTRGMPREVPI